MTKPLVLLTVCMSAFVVYSGIEKWTKYQIGEKFNPAHTLKADSSFQSRIVSKRLVAPKGVFTDIKLYYSKTTNQLKTIEFIGNTDKGIDVIAEWVNRELKISLNKGFPEGYYFFGDYSNQRNYKLEITTDTIERIKGVKSTVRRAHFYVSGIGIN